MEIEIPYGDKVIRLRVDVVSVMSGGSSTATTRPILRPKFNFLFSFKNQKIKLFLLLAKFFLFLRQFSFFYVQLYRFLL